MINMPEIAEWKNAVDYKTFLKSARENVEIMKARYVDLLVNEEETEALSRIQNRVDILVFGTDRCNDTAGNLPVLARMASLSPNVELRILDSDKNGYFHEALKVNGKKKTPVVLFLSSNHNELLRWTERPTAAYKIMNEMNDSSLEERSAELRKLYSDPEILRQSLSEFMSLLRRADYVLGRH